METTTWTQVGSLNSARRSHATIFDGSSFLVIGGYATDNEPNSFRTEKCILLEGNMTCTEQEPTLDNYHHFPELVLVNDDFGKNIETCT